MKFILENKKILVTGSGRGIGSAIACRCAEEGANVVINYLSNKEAASKTYSYVKAINPKCALIQADVRKKLEVKRLVEEVADAFGSIDILINNAHTPFELKSFPDLSWEDLSQQIEGTIESAFNCTKYALPYLRKSQAGVILNISSIFVRLPEKGFTHRNIVKAALEEMTRCLSVELANDGIRVNALAPGWTMTDQLKSFSEEYLKQKMSNIPAMRFATPEEIANVALYIISPLSGYVTGAVWPVAGGLTPELR